MHAVGRKFEAGVSSFEVECCVNLEEYGYVDSFFKFSHVCTEEVDFGKGDLDVDKIRNIFQSHISDARMFKHLSKECDCEKDKNFLIQELNRDLFKLKDAIRTYIKSNAEYSEDIKILVRDVLVPQVREIKCYENYFDDIC